jgi:hypothetical protein
MKRLGVALLVLLAGAPVSVLWGQYGSVGGYGNVVFPGLGHAPAGPNPFGNVVFPATPGPGYNAFRSVTNTGFAGSLGGVVSGLSPYTGGHRRARSSGVFSYPAYVGGYGYAPASDDSGQQQPESNVTVVNPPAGPAVAGGAPQEAQRVDADAESDFHFYQAPSAEPSNTPPVDDSYYLIAFKDHTIYSAVAYYVDGDTLHYFTAGNVHNQVSVALVDSQLTEQLNQQRGVEMHLAR